MNRQVFTFLITKPRSNKLFLHFSYNRHAALAWAYRIFFNLITTSPYLPSLLKSLGSSKKTGPPIGIFSWAKACVKSILWLCKPIVHCKINTNLTVAHCTTGEYEFRGLGDSLFWICPLTQYLALNFLIIQSGFLLHLKYHVSGSTLWSEIGFLETIYHLYLLIRLWILSSIPLKYYSKFFPDKASIYVGVSGSWLWYLRT